MTRVVIDAAIRLQLHGLNEILELCDESGQTIGYFHPVTSPGDAEDARAYCPLSDEELLRRQEEPGGRPLADILADLQRQ